MSSVNFSQVTEDTKIEVLWQTCSLKQKIKVWEKGTDTKFVYKVEHLDEKTLALKVSSVNAIGELNTDNLFLVNFIHYGIHYFASVNATLGTEKNTLILDFSKDLFKCERRNNFRVTVYPEKDYELLLTASSVPAKARQELKGHFEYNEKTRFRIFDISANGIAFLISKFWDGRIKANDTFENITIEMEEKFEIEECKVIYIMDCSDGRDEQQGFKKCALTFTKIEDDIESKLIKSLTGELAGPSFDEDFEDFLD